LGIDSALAVDKLRQSFEHHDWLVRPRHDGLGNSDEFILLAEYRSRGGFASPHRAPSFAPGGGSTRPLKLRQRDIELRGHDGRAFDHSRR